MTWRPFFCCIAVIFIACTVFLPQAFCDSAADLINAAKSANSAKVSQLLSLGADVDSTDTLGKTALFWACYLGHEDVAEILLDKGADADVKDRYGSTALLESSNEGRCNLIKMLLDKREVFRFEQKNIIDVLANVKRGSDIVKPLKNKLIEIDVRDKKGNTPLMLAAGRGRLKCAEILLAKGADPYVRNMSGLTASALAEKNNFGNVAGLISDFTSQKASIQKVMAAADSGDLDTMKTLIPKSVQSNAADRVGRTPLMRAAVNGRGEVIKYLLNNGALIDSVDSGGNTALMLAAENGSKDAVVLLLNLGSDKDVKNSSAATALDIASQKGWSEVADCLRNHAENTKNLLAAVESGNAVQAKELLEKGAGADIAGANGAVPLTVAAKAGNVEIIEILVGRGVKINVSDAEGDSPLMGACRECRLGAVKSLLAAGADPEMKDKFGYSALKVAADLKNDANKDCGEIFELLKSKQTNTVMDSELLLAAETGNLQTVQAVLKKGADIDAEDDSGRTPLMKASLAGHIGVVKFLVDGGADITEALPNAVAGGHIEVVKFLLEAGATTNGGPVAIAAGKGYREILQMLLEKGADVNESYMDENEYECTPLIAAVKENHAETVKLLLERDADVNLKDSEGKTAVEIATQAGRGELVTLLGSVKKKSVKQQKNK